jgi:hypothetical protein
VILSIAAAACTQQVETVTPVAQSTRTITLQPTQTTTRTATTYSTSTPIPLPFTDFREFEPRCPRVESALPTGFLKAGTVFLYKPASLGYGDVLTLTAQDSHPLLSNYPSDSGMRVSPDGKWLVFMDFRVNLSQTFSSFDGQTHFTYRWHDHWGNIQTWLGSDQVVIDNDQRIPARVDILDILTGQIDVFSPDLQDVYEYGREISGWGVWKLAPDPTLTRFVYVRDNGTIRPDLVLVDLEHNKTLWDLRRFTPGDTDVPPEWSPDGKWLAVIATDYFADEQAYHLEFFTVSRDGEAIQWMNVKVDSDTFDANPILVYPLRWSPDGRYYAFYGESLYIFDIQTRQIFDLCVPNPTFIIWSPDSKQIITKQDNAKALVIDLERNLAAPLLDDPNIYPFGWLKAP